MTRASAVALGVALAACGPSGDALRLRYTFTAGDEQACLDTEGDRVTACNEVPMTCDAVVLMRIVDPDDPSIVYVDECKDIPSTLQAHDLCALSRVEFDQSDLPTDRVEIQLAIYAATDLPRMPEPDSGDTVPICPASVDFSATGFATAANLPEPALAGIAYSTGYDDAVTVELGCYDRGRIDTEECRDENALDVVAQVIDFDTKVSVSSSTATMTFAYLLEPQLSGNQYVVDQSHSAKLDLDLTDGPVWYGNNLDLHPTQFACLLVQEANSTLSCTALSGAPPTQLELTGVRLDASTLADVLSATGLRAVPATGLVVGAVVTPFNVPAIGARVQDTLGSTIAYLSADRTSIGGDQITASGLFVSTDARLSDAILGPNAWSASSATFDPVTHPVGGLIAGQVTVVIIVVDLHNE